MNMNIFGVHIDGSSLQEIMSHVEEVTQPFWIVTANPEILLEAHRDSVYAQVVRQADVRTVDGVGLSIIGRLFGRSWLRVTGVELAERLIEHAFQEGLRVGFVGGTPHVAEAARAHWNQRYPGLQSVAEEGGRVALDGTDDGAGEEARHRLTLFAPDILLVAFGHPKQERWIARYLMDFPQLRVVVGVGGTFDYWAGRVSRAPSVLRAIGLEWMWRLLVQPSRILRIVRAVFVFPVLVLFDQFLKYARSL